MSQVTAVRARLKAPVSRVWRPVLRSTLSLWLLFVQATFGAQCMEHRATVCMPPRQDAADAVVHDGMGKDAYDREPPAATEASSWLPPPIFKHPSLALAEHSASSFTTQKAGSPAADPVPTLATLPNLARTSTMPLPARKLSLGSRGLGSYNSVKGAGFQHLSSASATGFVLRPVHSVPATGPDSLPTSSSLPLQQSLPFSLRRVASMFARSPPAASTPSPTRITDSSGSTSTGFSSRYQLGYGQVGSIQGTSRKLSRSGASTWSRSSSSGGSLLMAAQDRLAEVAAYQSNQAAAVPPPVALDKPARDFAALFIKALMGGHANWGSWPEIGTVLAEDCEMITADDEVFTGRTAIIRRLNKGMQQFLKMVGMNEEGADQPAAEQLASLAGKVESSMEVEVLSKKKGKGREARQGSTIVVVTYTFKLGMRRFKLQDRFKCQQGLICRLRRLRL